MRRLPALEPAHARMFRTGQQSPYRSILPLIFLLSPIVIFAAFTFQAIELQSSQVIGVSRQAVLRQAARAIDQFKTGLRNSVDALAQATRRPSTELAQMTTGPLLVYVVDAKGRLLYPRSPPTPTLDEPIDDKALAVLLRSQLRWEGATSMRALAKLMLASPSGRVRAAALLRLATGASDPAEARYYLHVLADRYPGAKDVSGITIGPVAVLLDVAQARKAHAMDTADQELLALLQDLAYRRYALDDAETSLLLERVLAQLHEPACEAALTPIQRRRLRVLEDDPYTKMQDRIATWRNAGRVDGQKEILGHTPYVVFARRVDQTLLVAIARADALRESLQARLDRIDAEGCKATIGLPSEALATYEVFPPLLEVPYLDTTVTLLQDHGRLESLAATRRRIMIAGMLLALSAFVLGGVLIFRDVSGRLELAHLKSEFVANMSHELKTPLTAIRMYAETLFFGRCRGDKRRDYLARILRESKHLTQLIDNVLQLSRADQARLEGRKARVALARLLADAVADVENRWEGLVVHTDVPEEMALHCDPELVTVALANVLDNAAKYSAAGKPITVRARSMGTRVSIAISDQGRGVPVAERSKIFERFFRASNAQDRKGMGLGLYLVRRIAEIHGGTALFESVQGAGSTVTLELPAAAEFVARGDPVARKGERS